VTSLIHSTNVSIWVVSFGLTNIVNFEVSEAVLLQDIIYTYQGIQGKYIKFNAKNEHFSIDPSVKTKYFQPEFNS
jgi:hypothetical protein